jgi:alkyl hydroperoxide reductase subunit AhpC
MSLIGKKAPDWNGVAYVAGERKRLSAGDFDGQWYVLYFYPADFTFVCPTEITGFEELLTDFEDDEVAIIGASTDSFFCHRAWFSDGKVFETPITHPVLADASHEVSRAFDVLKEGEGIAYRATVIVDDGGVVRSVSVNDTEVGRSPTEVLRAVQAFQSGGLCGADWQKGDDFVG